MGEFARTYKTDLTDRQLMGFWGMMQATGRDRAVTYCLPPLDGHGFVRWMRQDDVHPWFVTWQGQPAGEPAVGADSQRRLPSGYHHRPDACGQQGGRALHQALRRAGVRRHSRRLLLSRYGRERAWSGNDLYTRDRARLGAGIVGGSHGRRR